MAKNTITLTVAQIERCHEIMDNNTGIAEADIELIDIIFNAVVFAAFAETPIYVQQVNIIEFDNVVDIDNRMI